VQYFYVIIYFNDEFRAKFNYHCNDPSIWPFIRNSRINLVCFRVPYVIIDFWISCSARYNRWRAFKWQRQYRWEWQRRVTTTTIYARAKEGARVRTVIDGVLFWQELRYTEDLGTILFCSEIPSSFPTVWVTEEQYLRTSIRVVLNILIVNCICAWYNNLILI